MSQFRWFHIRPRRILLIRPAGFSVTVDDPRGRSHCPRARRLPRVNSATGLQLTAPCSLLSLIRLSFRLRVRRTVHRRTDLAVGFPPCGRPRARHSGDQRFGSVAASDSGSISFVSYPPLQVSNNSTWSHLSIMTRYCEIFRQQYLFLMSRCERTKGRGRRIGRRRSQRHE